MTFQEAKNELDYILQNQKTVEVTKLNFLLSKVNFSLENHADTGNLKKIVRDLQAAVNDIQEVQRQ